jgi:Do/DeqQ family serine protease
MAERKQILQYAVVALVVAALSVGGGALGSRLAQDTEPDSRVYQPISDPATTAERSHVVPAALTSPLSVGEDTDIAHAFQQRFRAVSASTIPVVVEVNVVSTVTQPVITSPFDFFGAPNGRTPQREVPQRGLGSGVIVDRDGSTVYVLTNDHVAGGADEIEIVLNDGRTFPGDLVGHDSLMDLALVSFETDADVPVARLGDSESLAVGDWVFAVGNPLGYQSTVTAGIVSAIGRDAATGQVSGVTDYIQTDAAINRGNSGGPLVNIDGQVVGINTWIASGNGGSIGLGFAIPVNSARRAINDFISSGEVSYSWLGVKIGSVSDLLAADLELGSSEGALVYSVYEDAPAAESGILPGDVITAVNGREIDGYSELIRTVAALAPGEPAEFRIIRDGQPQTLTVRTARRTADAGSDAQKLWPGFTVLPLTDEVRQQLANSPSGSNITRRMRGVVIASVEEGSPAADAGLRSGDIILKVNDREVESATEFYQALRSADDDAEFRVSRNGREFIVGFRR